MPKAVDRVLTRRTGARTTDLARLRKLVERGEVKVSPKALERGRKQAREVVAEARRDRRPGVKDESAAKLDLWRERKKEIGARLQAALAKRPMRSPEQILAELADRATKARKEVRTKERRGGQAKVVVYAPEPEADERDVMKRLKGLKGGDRLAELGAHVTPLSLGKGPARYFEITLPVDAHQLKREIHNIAWALKKSGAFQAAWPSERKVYIFKGEPTHAKRAPRTFAWHLDMIRGREAHILEPGDDEGAAMGEGAVVAHPDTGWAPHPEYNRDRIDTGRSHNVISGDTGGDAARHSIRMADKDVPQIGHGTATGCLIVGGPPSDRPDIAALEEDDLDSGGDKPQVDEGHIIGVAPKADVVPIRFISNDMLELNESGIQGAGVVRIGDRGFVEFIDYATSIDADVMSLSVGGTLSNAVRDAFDDAILDHDMIIVAATGQTYFFNILSVLSEEDSVIEPARFQNVIAVAGSTVDGRPWDESHRGPNADITAPADGVWVAEFDTKRIDEATDERRSILQAASGTSFATAITAGAAALWVAHWGGREKLKETYPDTPLAWVFREVLQRTAGPVFDAPWDTEKFGPGVLNLERMLEEPLPAPADVPEPPATVANLLTSIEEGLVFLGEMWDWLGDRFREGEAAVRQGIVMGAALFEQGVQIASDALATGYAALEDAADDAKDMWQDAVTAGEQLVRDGVEAAEDMADAAVDAGEEAVDEIVEVVEEGADVLGECVDTVVGWFT